MTSPWERRELGAVSTINYGHTESASDKPVGPKFLRITDIQNGNVDWDNVPFCKIHKSDLPKYLLADGDIVFARTGATTGKSFLVADPPEAVFASYLIRLRLRDKMLLPKFVSYFFQTGGYWESIEAGSTGSAQGGFNATKLGALSIPIPLLEEQKRIVGILNEAFEGIAKANENAEKNLQNARDLFKAHLNAIFAARGKGWLEEPIGSFCDIKHGFAFDGADFSNDVPEGSPVVITPGNFTEDGKLNFNEKNTKRFKGKAPSGFSFNVGDLVVVMTDLSSKMKILGKPAFVESANVLHNQRIGRVVFLNHRIQSRLLYYFLMSEPFLKNIKASATGTMVKHTAPKRILSNFISFPRDRDTQLEIVSRLDSVHGESQRLESLYRQKLTALEELKKSLLHEAFTGAL
jgi:type I restriction enzyme, S subunit